MVFQSIVCTTTPAERIHPQQIQQTGTATLMELTSTIQLLNARYHNDSVARQIGTRLEPLISFVERYAKSLDILSQGIPLASIIWGALRVLLEVFLNSKYTPQQLKWVDRFFSIPLLSQDH
jgi:hypothetical protein